MNYFYADGTRELTALIEGWRDPQIRAVVLTGGIEGKFITHYSVEELLALASDREAMRGLASSTSSSTTQPRAPARWRDGVAPAARHRARQARRLHGQRHEGRKAILDGIRKSVNGFDRKFTVRRIEVRAVPESIENGLAVPWSGTYEKEGLPPLTIRARTEARYEGDRIIYIADVYEDDPTGETTRWFLRHGADFDGSYT
jgi:hypothetical protein